MKPNTLKIALSALTVAVLAGTANTSWAEHPVRVPEIGIRVKHHREVNHRERWIVEGWRVVRDFNRRPLYRQNSKGQRKKYYFRVGHDVIMNINGRRVSETANLSRFLRDGWNDLDIWDGATRRAGIFKIEL